MFFESFKITASAVSQIFFIAAIGYFLIKKEILGHEGLNALSCLVVEITLPILIFCQLLKDFRLDLYPNWWLLPVLSIIITVFGLLLAGVFVGFIHGQQHKAQFLSLIAFQNAGYLPLALIAAMFPNDKSGHLLTYLFLFLLGFNVVIWSLGAYILSFHENRKFELGALFSPPVIAILLSLAIIFLGLNRFIPDGVLKPLRLVGNCTLPLAMFVVGGSLAFVRLKRIDKKAMVFMVLTKLIIMPLLGLLIVLKLKITSLAGLLILIQLAMPPATSLSVIIRHYKKEDFLISQGIFIGHIASLITLPLFLSLYFTLVMIQ
ncbi:MAG: AEC family transporter [Candidatus Omnitrophota bacterium]|nr:AEC family transporter [Candidatus Omnitrophota bacterium]